MFGIMYFLLVLPMQRQRKKQKEMLEHLKSGDIVTTTGGIVGSIISMAPETVVLRVKPDNVKLQFARSAIAGVATEENK